MRTSSLQNKNEGTLSQEEKDQLFYNEFLTNLESESVIEILSTLPARQLYTLSSDNVKVRELCEKKEFNELLIKSSLYPACLPKEAISSIDEKITVTPFHQLMGYYLLIQSTKLAEAKDPTSFALLNKACEENSYHALNARMEMNLEELKVMQTPEAKIDITVMHDRLLQVIGDAEQIGNLYRSLGYFQAATILLDAAKIYLDFEPIKKEIELYKHRAASVSRQKKSEPTFTKPVSEEILEIFLEKAMEFFYLSYYSAESPLSKSLNLTINAGENFLSEIAEYFKDPTSTDTFMRSAITTVLDIRSPHLFFNAHANAQKQAATYPLEYSALLESKAP